MDTPNSRTEAGQEANPTGRILVATDGTEGALGALRLAHAIAERDGSHVSVVTIVEALLPYPPDLPYPMWAPPEEFKRSRYATHAESVRRQLRGLGPAAAEWPLRVEVGFPARTIVRTAAEEGGELILLGIGPHGVADRWFGFGSETALQVIRLANRPVLAVPPDVGQLPQRALVAVDFTEFSVRALQTAVELLPTDAELHLAHVLTPTLEMPHDWIPRAREQTEDRLRKLTAEVIPQKSMRANIAFLEGKPAQELLRYAERHKVDLIASGSHGHGFWNRLLLGSVSSRLLRGAHCSVLVVPPTTAADAAAPNRKTSGSDRGAGVRRSDVPTSTGITAVALAR